MPRGKKEKKKKDCKRRQEDERKDQNRAVDGYPVGHNPEHDLAVIFRNGELQDLKRILNRTDLTDVTALLAAVALGKFDVVKKLLKDGHNINACGEDRITPLMWAAKNASREMVNLLVRGGAVVTLEDANGDNAVLLALQCPSWDQDTFLDFWNLVKDNEHLNVNHHNKGGFTLLHHAVKNQWDVFVEMLLEEGADVNCMTAKGHTPLMMASTKKQHTILRVLLRARADIRREDERGCTALCYAIAFMMKKHLSAPHATLQELVGAVNDDRSNLTMEQYLQRRLELLVTPPESDREFIYIINNVIKAVIGFYIRFIQAGLEILLETRVFSRVTEAVASHIDNIPYINALLTVMFELVHHCDCCFGAGSGHVTEMDIMNAFVRGGAADMCLTILKMHGGEGASSDLLLAAALLPLFAACSADGLAKVWLQRNHMELQPYHSRFLEMSAITYNLTIDEYHLRLIKNKVKLFHTLIDKLRSGENIVEFDMCKRDYNTMSTYLCTGRTQEEACVQQKRKKMDDSDEDGELEGDTCCAFMSCSKKYKRKAAKANKIKVNKLRSLCIEGIVSPINIKSHLEEKLEQNLDIYVQTTAKIPQVGKTTQCILKEIDSQSVNSMEVTCFQEEEEEEETVSSKRTLRRKCKMTSRDNSKCISSIQKANVKNIDNKERDKYEYDIDEIGGGDKGKGKEQHIQYKIMSKPATRPAKCKLLHSNTGALNMYISVDHDDKTSSIPLNKDDTSVLKDKSDTPSQEEPTPNKLDVDCSEYDDNVSYLENNKNSPSDEPKKCYLQSFKELFTNLLHKYEKLWDMDRQHGYPLRLRGGKGDDNIKNEEVAKLDMLLPCWEHISITRLTKNWKSLESRLESIIDEDNLTQVTEKLYNLLIEQDKKIDAKLKIMKSIVIKKELESTQTKHNKKVKDSSVSPKIDTKILLNRNTFECDGSEIQNKGQEADIKEKNTENEGSKLQIKRTSSQNDEASKGKPQNDFTIFDHTQNGLRLEDTLDENYNVVESVINSLQLDEFNDADDEYEDEVEENETDSCGIVNIPKLLGYAQKTIDKTEESTFWRSETEQGSRSSTQQDKYYIKPQENIELLKSHSNVARIMNTTAPKLHNIGEISTDTNATIKEIYCKNSTNDKASKETIFKEPPKNEESNEKPSQQLKILSTSPNLKKLAKFLNIKQKAPYLCTSSLKPESINSSNKAHPESITKKHVQQRSLHLPSDNPKAKETSPLPKICLQQNESSYLKVSEESETVSNYVKLPSSHCATRSPNTIDFNSKECLQTETILSNPKDILHLEGPPTSEKHITKLAKTTLQQKEKLPHRKESSDSNTPPRPIRGQAVPHQSTSRNYVMQQQNVPYYLPPFSQQIFNNSLQTGSPILHVLTKAQSPMRHTLKVVMKSGQQSKPNTQPIPITNPQSFTITSTKPEMVLAVKPLIACRLSPPQPMIRSGYVSRWEPLIARFYLTLPSNSQVIGDGNLTMNSSTPGFIVASGGNFGDVELGVTSGGRAVGVKRIHLVRQMSLVVLLKKVVQPLMTIKHIHILPYMLCVEHDKQLFVASPLCEYNLGEYLMCLKMNNCLNVKSNHLMKQLFVGLFFLHNLAKPIIHGNLKPSNVLINESGVIKLADFGIYEALYQNTKPPSSSLIWWSHETLQTYLTTGAIQCTTKSDVHVAGMLTHFILTGGLHPFGAVTDDILNNIMKGTSSLRTSGCEVNDLISWMLVYEPRNRPNIRIVCRHVYFWDYGKKWRFLLACSGITEDCQVLPLPLVEFHNSLDKRAAAEKVHGKWVSTVTTSFPTLIPAHISLCDTAAGLLRFIRVCVEDIRGNHPPKFIAPHFQMMQFFLTTFPALPLTVFRLIEGSEWASHPVITQFINLL